MQISSSTIATSVFLLTLAATFFVSFLARRQQSVIGSDAVSEQKLSRWLIGLSAGATANSGFVVTGAVGLGYSYGLQWVLLPLAWLLGDIAFWLLFPPRINRIGKELQAETVADMIIASETGRLAAWIRLVIAVLTAVCLTGYVAAQWLAGQKFLQGAFGFEHITSLALFALLIVSYSAIGGFRGSVYADSLQAGIRIFGTVVAMIAIAVVAAGSPDFHRNIDSAGPDFLSLTGGKSLTAVVGFVLGFAAAALGFGLGQPQMISRFVAGESPAETKAAWWIYMLFVQFTWISMTLFGIGLRGVTPGMDDPETGLSQFFHGHMGPLLTGLIIADVFATIAATSNSLLVAVSQTISSDIINRWGRSTRKVPAWILITATGIVSMTMSLTLNASVVDVALSSVSLMSAGLAPAMAIRLMRWRSTLISLYIAIITGIATAIAWHVFGLGGIVNESLPGIVLGLTANALVVRVFRNKPIIGTMEHTDGTERRV